jgi:hypothetical protein
MDPFPLLSKQLAIFLNDSDRAMNVAGSHAIDRHDSYGFDVDHRLFPSKIFGMA